MKKLKVMTVVGTRPEIIRLSRVIALFDLRLDHILIHTGQNYDYELNQVFFDDLELNPPARYLEAAGSGPAETIGRIIARIDPLLQRHRPDAFLVLGDTNSCLSALAAKRRKIPVFHLEAGNRCFDQRVPEEINRALIDHLADVNLPYSSIAREYLLREGIPPDRVIKTGSPIYEVLAHYRGKIAASGILERLGLKEGGYLVVSVHREENLDLEANFARLVRLLRRLGRKKTVPVIVTAHPRTRKKIRAAGVELPPGVRLLKPLGFTDYVRLQQGSRAVLSDSGTITEEASILNFPALNLRQAHERPEGMEEGAVILTGLEPERVLRGLEIVSRQPRGEDRLLRLVEDYRAPAFSEKVLRIVLSYTDYVNRVVWRKPE